MTTLDKEELASLRGQIDLLDKEIAALLAKRQDLVRKAAALKSTAGEGAVSAERERLMLEQGARLEEQYSLPEHLMRDIKRRILRQSYTENGGGHYTCALATPCKVVIVGGCGAMGRFFVRYLEGAGYSVSTVEPHDYTVDSRGQELSLEQKEQSVAVERLAEAKWCIVSVPIDVTVKVIEEICPYLAKDCILSDLTSVKEPMVECMLQHHQGPVLGLHPMFGPSTYSFVKQVVVAVPGRRAEESHFILDQLKFFGAKVVQCSGKEHDEAMRVIQALRHFTTFAYGVFLRKIAQEEGATIGFLQRLLELSSPVYHLELMMVGRLFAQDPRLYCDIICASSKNLELIQQYLDCAEDCLSSLRRDERDGFTHAFMKTTEFFGEQAQIFLQESSDLLSQAQDSYPVRE